MAYDDLLFKSIFTLFLGFLTFLSIILNKIYMVIGILDNYFVLFFFGGIAVSVSGIVMLVIWHFRNRKPFYEENEVKAPPLRFVPYLSLGAVFTISGLFVRFHFSGSGMELFVISMASSILGILLLLNGLRHFIKEVIIKKPMGRTAVHS